MKHQSKGRKLGRKKEQRIALLKSLSNSLIKHGKIKTTEAKAKELRPHIEKLITRSKEGTLANRRILTNHFSDNLVKKMIDEIGPKYKERNGGYTRITKLGPRLIDGSPMAIIELV
ncbi:MAG: 50S ribosomal protein L17 [Candidatus Marinimicrobia bacterium]|nr:50S ribosomal protein L17 [Candidatus Neomarinimicrobiota bacterium]